MPGGLDSCISSVYEDGNIAASSGIPPVRVVLPPATDPEDYDPDDVVYSLDFTKFWNSMYAGIP
jgi:hypothetical protein